MERIRKDHIEALREIKSLQVKFIVQVCVNTQLLCAVLIDIIFKGNILHATEEQ